jgi:hypothetical protein
MHRVPLSLCTKCARPLTAATETDGGPEHRPDPGAISICAYCGYLMIFDTNLRLRELTEAELDEIMSDRELSFTVLRARRALREFKELKKSRA